MADKVGWRNRLTWFFRARFTVMAAAALGFAMATQGGATRLVGPMRGGEGGGSAGAPSDEAGRPSFEVLHARMLKLFAEAPWAWTNIHPERNPVSVDLFPRDRDKEAWALLVEGVRKAKPGLAVSRPPSIVLECGFDMGDGSHENRAVLYQDGMLSSPVPYFGGMIRTLKVGPEFERGLRMLEETVPEVEFDWPEPLRDESAEGAREAKVSRADALRIARGFAAGIELPLGDDPQVRYRLADWPYGPRWEVGNPDFAVIAVDARDGSVVLADNQSASWGNMQRRVVVNVTEEQAKQRASSILEMMKARPEEVLFEKVDLWRGDDGKTGRWLVLWDRATAGIPYQSDELYVLIDSDTGGILYATKRWWSAPPEVTETGIGKERAREIALGLAEAIGAREIDGIRGEPALKIVQPNYYYPKATEARRTEYQGATRVAWEAVALLPSAMPGAHVRESILWIDAVTGELLGGYSCMGAGPVEAAPAPAGADVAVAPKAGGPDVGGGTVSAKTVAGGTGAALAALAGVVALSRRRTARKRKGMGAAGRAA